MYSLQGFWDSPYTSKVQPENQKVSCVSKTQALHWKPYQQCLTQQYVIYYNERLKGVIYPYFYLKHAYNDLCQVAVFEIVYWPSIFLNISETSKTTA